MLVFCYVSEMLTNIKECKMHVVQLNTRVPDSLKAFLTEQAKLEGRSLNNYVVQVFKELKDSKNKSAKA